jgi:glycosyltransferase involved in cell wall biosynthesis
MSEQSRIHLSVIIPAYNEELRLPHTLGQSIEYLKAQSYSSEIIVVNDGSTDRTDSVARRFLRNPSVAMQLLAHPDGANHGKGASVRLGMLKACGAYRLFMDADNSTSLDQVDRFWPMLNDGYHVVIGSRALEGSTIISHQPRRKELAGRLGNRIIRACAVPGISDTQAGFKIFAGEEAEKIFARQTTDRWGSDIEVLVIARFRGCRIAEVPITWNNAAGSKVTAGSYLQVLWEIRRIRRNLKAGLYK